MQEPNKRYFHILGPETQDVAFLREGTRGQSKYTIEEGFITIEKFLKMTRLKREELKLGWYDARGRFIGRFL
jgi:hypothetical protein